MAVIAASGGWRQGVILAVLLPAGLLSVGLLPVGKPAAAAQCPPVGLAVPRPTVRLEVSVAEPVVHNHHSRDEIAALAGRVPMRGKLDAGLTRTETQVAVTPTVSLVMPPNGRACVMLASVEASWRMVSATIDVAAEYRPGSCEYAAVLEHERDHVRLTRRAFDAHAARLEARLREQAAAVRPFVADAGDAAQAVTDRLMAVARQVMDQFREESRRVNGAIDTAESYRAVSAKCRQW